VTGTGQDDECNRLFTTPIFADDYKTMKGNAEPTSTAAFAPYHFQKDTLPKMLSYPVKRSLLDAALRSADVYGMLYAVSYVGRHNNSLLMDAFFTEEQHTQPLSAGRVLLRVWAVPNAKRHQTEAMLVASGLPILCQWLQKAQAEANVWRGKAHRLLLEVADENIRVVEE